MDGSWKEPPVNIPLIGAEKPNPIKTAESTEIGGTNLFPQTIGKRFHQVFRIRELLVSPGSNGVSKPYCPSREVRLIKKACPYKGLVD